MKQNRDHVTYKPCNFRSPPNARWLSILFPWSLITCGKLKNYKNRLKITGTLNFDSTFCSFAGIQDVFAFRFQDEMF